MKKAFGILVLALLLIGMTLLPLRIPAASAASLTSINNAIAKGLTYLKSTQAADGAFNESFGYAVAGTAMAVLAFENNGHYGWNTSDPYQTTVQKGLNYLFGKGTNVTMTVQPAGNPDVSGSGIGIVFYDDWTHENYETSMVLMAIIGSNAPTNVTGTGTPIGDRTYKAIAQDTVDFLAWAQNDPGDGWPEGGWGYYAGEHSWSDNSNTAWPILGLMAAKLWGINAPAWVATELKHWIATTQWPNLSGTPTTNPNYGAFVYNPPNGILGGVTEAASGILEMTYAGMPATNANVTAAEGFINRRWTLNDAGWNVNFGNLYTMYSVMKAMRETTPPIKFIAYYNGTNGVEWYNGTGEYADALVGNQSADGHWINWKPWNEANQYSTALSTALAVLILQGGYSAPVVVHYTLRVTVDDDTASPHVPIVGATVSINGPSGTLSNTTKTGGLTEFDRVLGGGYTVTTSMPGYITNTTSITLNSNYNITVSLLRMHYTLRVTVDDDSVMPHVPIVGATISIAGPQTLSNTTVAGGLTEFDRILAGDYTVTTSMPGYITNTTSITLNSNYSITVSLPRAPVVGGISIATGIGIAPYIGLISALAVAAVAVAVCLKRGKRGQEKQ